MQDQKKIIAFFDFDGTVTKKDTFFQFIIFDAGYLKLFLGIFYLFIELFRSSSRSQLKEKLFSAIYKGEKENKVRRSGKIFCDKILPKLLRRSAMERIHWHLHKGHGIYIVTASSSIWLGEWCHQNAVKLISTEYQVANNVFTGRYANTNCKGHEKVARIIQLFDLTYFDAIYAYGDSKSDIPMMNLATYSFYKCFIN